MNTESETEICCKTESVFKVCSVCKIKGDKLQVAPYFVCAFFSLETDRVSRVCSKCYGEAENHQSVLVNLLVDRKSVFTGPRKPKNQVEIVDLDDDDDDVHFLEEHEESREEVEIEDDVDDVVKHVMDKYCFGEQLDAASLHLHEKCKLVEEELTKLDVSNSEITKHLSALKKELFDPYEPILCHVDSVDIDQEGKVSNHSTTLLSSQPSCVTKINELPPVGEFIRQPLQVNQPVYAMKDSLLKPWVKGFVFKIKDNSEMPYEVCFENTADKQPRKFPLKYLAYAEPSPVQFVVGFRVIAQYVGDDNEFLEPSSYYAGIVAEEAKFLNQERYLVFFDQGYVQYCKHEQIMMVCRSSKDVWHDVYSKSRYFVSSYLSSYPERAMVKLQRGQSIKTELNGFWFNGRVDAVDASVARICFASEKRFEWIYRGSTRFRHLYDLLANEEARKKQGNRRPTRPIHNMSLVHKKKNAPYVEYTGGNVDVCPPAPSSPSLSKSQSSQNGIRAVAKKSTSKVFKSPTALPTSRRKTDSSEIDDLNDQVKRQLNVSFQQVYFEPHQCGSECLKEFPFKEGDNKNVNPLSIPLRCGWSREFGTIRTQRKTARTVIIIYRAPCGRRMRNMDELHRYLRITKSDLGIDLFCFDSRVNCFREFEPEIVYSRIEDISYGKENVRVSCVNSIDRRYPEHVHYCTERLPREGVNINLDSNFLVCCDCTDDCQDKEKCRCWQLTITSTARGPGGKINQNAGYEHRRLPQTLVTAIFECNSRCACRKTCVNRVAQRPLQLRLQLFRTEKCGWGIRCLDDIPKGQFISVYVGELLTDHDANKFGKEFGDEYLADLNFIELTEGLKEGYESESYQSDMSSLESQSGSDDDWGESSDASGSKNSRSRKEAKKSRTEKTTNKSRSRKAVKPIDMDDDRKIGTRDFYGPNENCFVIDARNIGNIGRYFNHSCEPNIFGQNIFIDTHDMRFPWMALFTKEFVRAGTELTWDYGYEVNSIPGRRLDCFCGAKKCRLRLL